MSHVSYSTRLVLKGKEDKQKLLKMLESQRFAWNECSKTKFNIKNNSIVELHAAFYRKFRDSNPEIPSQVIISAEQSVLSIYRSIKSNKRKINKAPEKKALSIRLDKRTYSYKNGVFSLISLGNRIKCSIFLYLKLQELINKYEFCDPELFVKNDEIWMVLTFNTPDIKSPNKLALGVDLGCRVPAATSEGKLFIDRKFNAEKRRLRYLKRCLQSKSRNSKSAKRHLKKLKRKERNKNKNFSHHLANKILKTNADTIVLENLKSIKVKKHKYQNKNRISQVPLAELRSIITYKAPLKGKTVMVVSPSYTSQIDNRTGKKDGLRNGRRYIGKDGVILDADINAAINIAKRSKLPVSGSNAIYGQATVNSPIVGSGSLQASTALA